jgi:putative ABC transport system ATP-binding protein
MTGGVSIVVQGVTHAYRVRGGDLVVLDDVNLEVAPGAFVSIMGPSGSGKSTLLALIGGLEPQQRGELVVGGRSLGDLSRNDLAAYRRTTVGFVFQHFGLLDTLTAAENVAVARLLVGDTRAEARRRALALLDRIGLGERSSHRPQQLSGGERQRVAIARALANEPRLLLADEPTGNLDEENGARTVGLLQEISAEDHCTVVAVTHDQRVARSAAQRYVLSAGRMSRVLA